jgi:hypothetical protein
MRRWRAQLGRDQETGAGGPCLLSAHARGVYGGFVVKLWDLSMFSEVDLYAFIGRFRLGVLNTISSPNTPQSALMGFAVTPALEIVFDTVKSSRKYPNLVSRPSCSFVIGWSGEQTVQYEGEAQELRSPELELYQAIYFKVWPDGPARMSWPGIVYFVVHPTWIRYSDFDQNPPLVREFSFQKHS